MPCKARDRAANGLLQVLRDPPVVLFLKVTDGDHAGSRTDSKLLLGWRPADARGRTVDSKKDQSRLPSREGSFPDIRIAIYNIGNQCETLSIRS